MAPGKMEKDSTLLSRIQAAGSHGAQPVGANPLQFYVLGKHGLHIVWRTCGEGVLDHIRACVGARAHGFVD